MEQAAQRALAGGDVVRASQANLDAAYIAHKQGTKAQVQRLGRTALRLAESPLITVEQRQLLVSRIRSTPAVAAVVTPSQRAPTEAAQPDGNRH
jgi:hypothetical protein